MDKNIDVAIVPDVDAIESDVADVSEARLKLDDLLNEIIDKNDDSLSRDEKLSRNLGTSATTPTKRHASGSGKAPRKKKKKEHVYEDIGDMNKPSYVIKLFDRCVDLAQFSSETPLYMLVREWTRNRPYCARQSGENLNMSKTISKDIQMEGDENEDDNIYDFPKPVKHEDACYPRPLPPALKTALIEDIINTENNIEDLRKDNMLRWRKVRNRWKEHSFRTQKRYLESLMILKETFMPQTG